MLSEYYLFSEDEFNNAKSRQLLPCKCVTCGKKFYRQKHWFFRYIKRGQTVIYCSLKCTMTMKSRLAPKTTISCEQCGKEFDRNISQIKKTKHNFCSRSCAAKYYNAHKTTGFRRSKLEIYLETKLSELFPNLEILYNDRNTLPSGLELDIYVPSLKLAFELNGPFHYIPVFGQEKFDKIQNNDYIKLKECQDLGINICVIDVSKDVKFTEKLSEKYLEIIKSFIR